MLIGVKGNIHHVPTQTVCQLMEVLGKLAMPALFFLTPSVLEHVLCCEDYDALAS